VVAPQFGIVYLPLHVIKAEKLIEKHLTKNGLPHSKVVGVHTANGAATNEALLSGNLHIVSGGSPPLLTIWDKTQGSIKGIGCFDATARYLNTINPRVTTLSARCSTARISGTPSCRTTPSGTPSSCTRWARFGTSRPFIRC
jgi:NitT/TauT family transport system substrate-binding protein